MKISERYSEYHEHTNGTCVTTHKRNINNKVFLFTYVGRKTYTTLISVTHIEQRSQSTHLLVINNA